MRILLFHFAELGGLGGVEVVVTQLASAFAGCGHPTLLVELGIAPKPRGAPGHGVASVVVPGSSYPTIRRPRSWGSLLRSALHFQRVVLRFRPHIVNVHFPVGQSLPVVAASVLPHRWKLVVTVHNSDIRVSPVKEPRLRPWQERLLRRAEAITAVSRGLLTDTVTRYPFTEPKSVVIYNGVSDSWFRPPWEPLPPIPETLPVLREPYVLFAGRYHPVKGIDVLLHAWAQLAERPDLPILLLAGDGPARADLVDLARELGIAHRVCFLGAVRQQDLLHLYRHARIVVLPSRREGFGLTLAEAGASGAVRVATNIPGVREIIEHGVTGFLAEPESPKSLADTLWQALSLSPERRRRIQRSTYESTLATFTEHRMVKRYLGLFGCLSGAT